MSAWANKYVGIPWETLGSSMSGCDCWGLVVLVLRDEFGIEMPRHDEMRAAAQENGEVRPEAFAFGATKADNVRPGDVLHMWGVINGRKFPIHAGIHVDPVHVLHIEGSHAPSHIIRIDRGKHRWRPIQSWRPHGLD